MGRDKFATRRLRMRSEGHITRNSSLICASSTLCHMCNLNGMAQFIVYDLRTNPVGYFHYLIIIY